VKFKYESRPVEKYFSDFKLMKKKMGKDLTRNTKKRYNELKAAANFSIYLSTGLGRPHPLSGNLKGYYGLGISDNVRLVVRPDVESLDSASLKKCDTVIIRGVMDYHGRKHEWFIP
jgi:Txe/YoeB family toxin of Txe-Axe toxin-antitoxin module